MNASTAASKRKPTGAARSASLLPATEASDRPDYGTKAFVERLAKKFHQAKRRAIANASALKKA